MTTVTKTLTARDIMIKKLVVLRPHIELFEAVSLLLRHQISGAPVVDYDGRYLGIFSERSSIRLLMASSYDNSPSTEILPFIDAEAKTISPETDVLSIMQVFLNTRYRRLPVLDKEGELIGQVSRRDVLRAVHKSLEQKEPGADDSSILYISGVIDRKDAPFT